VLRLLLGIAAAAVLWLPAPVGAATSLAPCKAGGALCGEVTVPLDYTGETPGTISLHVEELPSPTSGRGVIFLLAGGPGQGSAHTFDLSDGTSVALLRFLLPDYTLVAFDDRGTGSSGVLRCPGFQNATTVTTDQQTALVGACAASIGDARRFYSTADHAADIEAVRQALGFGKIGFFGVSYGTKLALAYALAYPANVDRLLLDSVLEPNEPDVYDANVARALPRTLNAFCAGLCTKVTRDFGGDVVTLANRIEAKPLRATVLEANGKRRALGMTGEDLLSTVVGADISPGLAAELPAAVRAALRGDPNPLVRLFDIVAAASVEAPAELSAGLYAATTCDDGVFPWPSGTPIGQRPALLRAAVAGLPAGTFGGFGSWVARTGTAQLCLQWPSSAVGAPPPAGPPPDVPLLVLSGGFDLRTPTASALAVASQFAQGHVLVVPGVGHSVFGADLSLCSQRAVRAWAVGADVPASCARVSPLVAPLGPFPVARTHLTAAGTTAAAAATVHEALAAWLQATVAPSSRALAGLYAGKLVADSDSFTLTRYAIAPGVELTGTLSVNAGTLPFTVDGTVHIGGSAAVAGTLHVSAGRVTRSLGVRAVRG
jgi:pimeloyl-ACP methyl ester carboxylesterase